MIIGTFVFYFIVFLVLFSYPKFNKNQRPNSLLKLISIPALLGLAMVFLTVVKVYFIYKILTLLFVAVMFLLTYWQWGDQIRRLWK